MSCHQAVYQWTAEVTRHLPHLSKPQATVLALWSLGMVLARSCAMPEVLARALQLAGQLAAEQDGDEALARRLFEEAILLTEPEFTRRYWAGTALGSDWKAGSPVTWQFGPDEEYRDLGQVVLESDPYRHLSYSWHGFQPIQPTR